MTYHTLFGFCNWDIVASVILVGTIAVFAVRNHKLKKIEKELEEQVLNLANEESTITE
ncbi:MAG: hypothetical protein PUD55_06190 [Firmicutes bacterium]|nr:hypothetical protein [Bacillota bacterium]